MREIKFRALTLKKAFTVVGNLTILKKDTDDYEAGHYISNSLGMPFAFNVRPETVSQYTGLKDKNGVEIFEGDICKKIYGSSTPIFAVAYHEARCAFIMQDGYNELLYTVNPNMIEVIGNIHENPELLK